MAKKPKTLIQRYEAIQKIGLEVEVPWKVWTFFADSAFTLRTDGTYIAMSGDYKSLDEAKAAAEWLVEQLGGKVTWKGGGSD